MSDRRSSWRSTSLASRSMSRNTWRTTAMSPLVRERVPEASALTLAYTACRAVLRSSSHSCTGSLHAHATDPIRCAGSPVSQFFRSNAVQSSDSRDVRRNISASLILPASITLPQERWIRTKSCDGPRRRPSPHELSLLKSM